MSYISLYKINSFFRTIYSVLMLLGKYILVSTLISRDILFLDSRKVGEN